MKYDVFISYNSTDKSVADAVCHYLEERKLRCFIAPRDITPPDWAGSITRAIENSKAFVIVVSEHSIESNEVAKEITLATRVSSYIFPFRVDGSRLDGRMTYHLSAFHWIDAVDPPMEQRLQELADRILSALTSGENNMEEELSGSRNLQRQRLLGQSVSPRSEFSGRTRELSEIHTLFEGGSNAVFLCGMGGIGKSEIAKAYAKEHGKEYDTVVFAGYETGLLELIASDQSVPVENLMQAGVQGETLQDYYERKMKVLRSLVDEHTLIIIDNFDTESDEHLEEVLRLPCRLLFTSRMDFSGYGYDVVKIGVMENFEDLLQIFMQVDRAYTAPEERKAVEEIIRLLDCHTYAVSLTAAQMKAGRIKPGKMLSQLKEQGLKIQTRSGFSRDAGAKKATAYEYIQAMFDFSGLDDTACGILQNLAFVPVEGFDIDLFMEFAGVEDFGDISRLIDLNWVQMDEENDRIGLHMLVREMVCEERKPTLESCEKFLRAVGERVDDAWYHSLEENRKIEGLVYALLKRFPEPVPEFLAVFEAYATFAWIQGNFEVAEAYEHKLYAMCEKTYGEKSKEAGNQALRVAAVYHNMGNFREARPWYELGYETLFNICERSHETCSACMKVGRSDAQREDYAAAEEKYSRSLNVLNELLEEVTFPDARELQEVKTKRAFALLDLAHIYACQGRSAEALPLAQESYEELKKDELSKANLVYVWMVLAYVYYGLENYGEAACNIGKALEDSLAFHGEINIDNMNLYEIQGDILAIQGECEKAEEAYSKALGGRELYFQADTEAIERLEKKYEHVMTRQKAAWRLQEIWP